MFGVQLEVEAVVHVQVRRDLLEVANGYLRQAHARVEDDER